MYNFSYFSPIHIETFVVSALFCTLLLFIPKIFKKIFGIFGIFFVVF